MRDMEKLMDAMMNERIPYAGTGVWIRIQHRFGPRMMEWGLAVITATWGVALLTPGDAFKQPTWDYLEHVFRSDVLLGWIMLLLGAARVIGLVINGARKSVTPQIRQWSAAIGCLIWVGISYCFWQSGIVGTWIAVYPWFAIGELINIHRAAHDQGETRNGKTG